MIGKDEIKKIEKAVEFYKDIHAKYHKCMSFAYESVLSSNDKKALKDNHVETFEVQSIKPYIDPQVKQLSDCAPNIKFNGNNNVKITEMLNAFFDKVKKQSKFDSQTYKTFKNSVIGGISVLKVKTAYCSDDSMDQDIFIESVVNPTCVYFDPAAREDSKSDADWVFELVKYSKDAFIDEFGQGSYDAAIKSYKGLDSSKIKWVEAEKGKSETLTVCEYYYYKKTAKYLAVVPDLTNPDGVSIEKYNMKKDIPLKAIKFRKVFDKRVMRKKFCAETVLEKPVDSNFSLLPYAFVCGDSYTGKNGKSTPSSFIEKSIDPMRMKTIGLNMFFYNMRNRIHSSVIVDPNVVPDEVRKQIAQGGLNRKMYEIPSTMPDPVTGQQVPVKGIQLMQREPVSPDEVEIIQVADSQLERIMGNMSPSQHVEQSGAFLTRLTDFISATADPFLQTYMDALTWIGKVIMTTLPRLSYGTYEFRDEDGITYQVPSDFNPNECTITVNRSLSTKLLKMESLKQLSQFAVPESALGQFLLSPQGSKYILQQLDLVNKEEIEADLQEFIGNEEDANKNKGPSPEQIEAQAKMTDAQSKVINAQANMQNAQAKHGQNAVNAQLGIAKLQAEVRKAAADEMFNVLQHLHQEKALSAENFKTFADIMKTKFGG